MSVNVRVEWSQFPPWMGRRVAVVSLDVNVEWNASWRGEVMGEVLRTGRWKTLVEVEGGAGVLGSIYLRNQAIEELVELGKGKGLEFCMKVGGDEWLSGGWEVLGFMEKLEKFVVVIERPERFEQLEGLAVLAQGMWFERNMEVYTVCEGREDLEMVEFIGGMIPGDIPLYVEGGRKVEEMMMGGLLSGVRFIRRVEESYGFKENLLSRQK